MIRGLYRCNTPFYRQIPQPRITQHNLTWNAMTHHKSQIIYIKKCCHGSATRCKVTDSLAVHFDDVKIPFTLKQVDKKVEKTRESEEDPWRSPETTTVTEIQNAWYTDDMHQTHSAVAATAQSCRLWQLGCMPNRLNNWSKYSLYND